MRSLIDQKINGMNKKQQSGFQPFASQTINIFNYNRMLPFGNGGHNNFITDPYSHSGFYPNQLYFVPEQVAQMFNPLADNENQEFPFQNAFQGNYHPFYEECPVKIEQRQTKPSEVQVNDDKQFSVSAHNLEESSQHSPQLRCKQKYGRNINSNIFHHMVRRLLVQQKLEEIIKKLIAREKTVLTQKQFMQFLARKQEKLPNYVSFQKMKKMFQGQKYRNRVYQETLIKEGQFCKIFRIVCRYYLKNLHLLHVYNMLKLKADSKRLHIAGSRRILDQTGPN